MKKVKLYFVLLAFLALVIWGLNACTKRVPKFVPAEPRVEQVDETPGFRTFRHEAGWGYDIFLGDSLLIHQENIPSLQGGKGFDLEKQAERTAILTIKKLTKNSKQFPMVSEEELDSMGVRLN